MSQGKRIWTSILAFALVALLARSGAVAAEPAIIGTFEDGNLALSLPTPAAGLPTPAQLAAAGLPGDAKPHGVAYRTADEALFTDFFIARIFRIRPSTGALIGTIALTGRTSANGTLAVSPNGDFAISVGERNQAGQPLTAEMVVIRGFSSGDIQVTPFTPALRVRRFATSAVAFAANGRAFICHVDGVSAVDPPYTSIAFTVPLVPTAETSACALSPDEQRLFVTRGGPGIGVAMAPFGPASATFTMLAPGGTGALGPMAISPDGNAVLVGQVFVNTAANDARAFIVRAPYSAASTMQEIVLPASVAGLHCGTGVQDCPGYEDMALDAAGTLAILTGGSSVVEAGYTGRAPAVFIRNPFNDATREVLAVTMGSVAQNNHGRGTGAVRFQPVDVRSFADGFE